MESSALNTAHKKMRRAEALLQEGKFAKAAEYHERVADVLGKVHSQVSANLIDRKTLKSDRKNAIPLVPSLQSLMALESLALQRDYHIRQSEVVRMKQIQYEEYQKKALENQRCNLLNELGPKNSERNDASVSTKREEGSLKQAIYRAIEKQDSLLNFVTVADNNALRIEELRKVNNHLRTLVDDLLCQLESKEHKVQILTERIKIMFSDADIEIQTSNGHSNRLAPLPPLAPLEMPLFDFNSS